MSNADLEIRPLGLPLSYMGSRLASIVPPLLFLYVVVIWQLLFAEQVAPIERQALGWTFGVQVKLDSILKQVAYPILFVLALIGMLSTSTYRRLPLSSSSIVVVLLFVALALLSVTWSVADWITARRSALLLVTTLALLFAVTAAHSGRWIIGGLVAVFFVATLLDAAALVLLPPTPLGYAGFHSHKNLFGAVACLILIFGFYSAAGKTWPEVIGGLVMIVMAPIFLLASQSKTSLGLAALAPAAGTFLWLLKRRYRMPPALLMGCSILALFAVYLLGAASGVWDVYTINQAIFGNATLTGRTEIWTFVLSLIAEQPIFGYGYEAVFGTGTGGLVEKNAIGFVRGMPTAHNGFLDIWAQLGLPGVILVITISLAMFGAAGRVSMINPRLGWLSMTVTFFVVMHNNLESDLMLSSNPLSMLALVLLFINIRVLTEANVTTK